MKTTIASKSPKKTLMNSNILRVEILNNLFCNHKKPFIIGDIIGIRKIENIADIISNKRYYIITRNKEIFVTIQSINDTLMIYDENSIFKGILTQRLLKDLNIFEALFIEREL